MRVLQVIVLFNHKHSKANSVPCLLTGFGIFLLHVLDVV